MGTAKNRPSRALWIAEPDPEYIGKPCIIVGGGPSLINFDLTPYQGLPTIAVNQSFELAPWAGYLFYADDRWYRWNEAALKNFKGTLVTVGGATAFNRVHPAKRMLRVKDGLLCEQRDQVAGIDSGCCAVNLAYHLGASRIILLGFDSGFSSPLKGRKVSHFHNKHQVEANEDYYINDYGPRLAAIAQKLRDKQVPVVRSTPPGMPEIPYTALPEALFAELDEVKGNYTTFRDRPHARDVRR